MPSQVRRAEHFSIDTRPGEARGSFSDPGSLCGESGDEVWYLMAPKYQTA